MLTSNTLVTQASNTSTLQTERNDNDNRQTEFTKEINQTHTRLTVDSLQLTFVPCPKSPDTKTRTNIKNPADQI